MSHTTDVSLRLTMEEIVEEAGVGIEKNERSAALDLYESVHHRDIAIISR